MTLDETAAKLYALLHEHMGTDIDAWRRDQDAIPSGLRASIMRQAEWVKEQRDTERSKGQRYEESQRVHMRD